MLTEKDCEEIGTSVGILMIKFFKIINKLIGSFFNSNKKTK